MIIKKFLLGLFSVCAIATPMRADPSEKVSFPVVFDGALALRKVGIAIQFDGLQAEPFANRCYFYGFGGYLLSISDNLLARYRARGFTLPSLCLGLNASINFDPETGKRIPTYIVSDVARIKADQKQARTYSMSDDVALPLSVPTCFRNGRPYRDCNVRYSMTSGQKLTDQQVARVKKLDGDIEALVKQAQLTGRLCGRSQACADRDLKGLILSPDGQRELMSYRRISGDVWDLGENTPKGRSIFSAEEHEFTRPIGWPAYIVVSPEYGNGGFGYMLQADGTAGPSLSASTVALALNDSRRVSQINPKALAQLLEP